MPKTPVTLFRNTQQGADVFLEMGPDAPLPGIGTREAPDTATWIASARRHQPAPAPLKQALLQLYSAGVELPWKSLLPAPGRRIQAPLYPFDTHPYYTPPQPPPTPPPTPPPQGPGRRPRAGPPGRPRNSICHACTRSTPA